MQFPGPALETKKGISEKSYPPEKTFFFERHDGSIFSTNEAEAWVIYSGKSQVVGWRITPPKLIGTSDGMIFNRHVAESKKIGREEGFEKAQEHVRLGYTLELEEARKHPQRPKDHSALGLNGKPVSMDGISI